MAGTIVQNFNGQSLEIPRQLTPYTPIDPEKECIGRDEDLSTLADTLRRSAKVVVVTGLGGIGKTTLAKAWFQAVFSEYDHIAWISLRGDDERFDRRGATFEESVAYHPTLSANLHLPFSEKEPPEARFRAVMNALRQIKGRNLLVLDNAGPDLEQADIRDQLPLPPHWQVLVTSRRKLNGYEQMRLDRLTPGHAAALFRLHYTGPCTDAELDALLQEVDFHTLTVELLAKTLENHLGSLSVGALSAKLRRRQLADPDLQRRISLHHSPEETEVYVHLLTTFDCAGLDAAERLLLARMAALPPGGAYAAAQLQEWLRTEPADRRALQETLIRLDRKGWLTRNPDHTFVLHRMVQQAVLYQLQPSMVELGVLVDTFTKKMSFDSATNFALLFQWTPFGEQLLAILPEAEYGNGEVGMLMNNLSIVFRSLGQYEKARDLLEASIQTAEKIFGTYHQNVITSQSNLATVYIDLGQYEKARDLLDAALQSNLKNFSLEHPNVAVCQSNLAEVYRNLEQYEKARDLLEAALQSDLKNFGPDHPTVAVCQSNLANVYRDLGEYEKARDLFVSALHAVEKNFFSQHPNVALFQSNLANVYGDLGEYEKACNLLEVALQSDLKNFGPEHPIVAIRCNNLACGYAGLGDKAKAMELFERALAIWRKSLGEEHPNVGKVLKSIAALQRQGDTE